MRYLLMLALVGCGDDGGQGTVDASNTSDTLASFCDGTPHEIGTGIVNAIAVDDSGRLLLVGTQFMPGPQTLFVRRLLPSGDLDTMFGTAGLVTRSGAITDGHAVLPRTDGTILVGAGIEAPSQLKPLVYALSEDGQPTGFEAIDSSSSSSVVHQIFEQGTSVIIENGGILRRVTPAGDFDAGFGSGGSKYTGSAVTITSSGFAVAVTQLTQIETYRVTADGMDVSGSAAMVETNANDVTIARSHDDRITFIGDVRTPTLGTYDLMVGRVLANNTFDTGSYAPSGFAVIQGVRPAIAAIELDDGTILAAVDGGAIVHINADGTLDQMHSFASANMTSVAAWNGHFTIAGTLSGGHAVVACF